MKLKLVILEMEADTAGGTDSLCRALAETLEAVFRPTEQNEEAAALSAHEPREG